jgi:2-dehydropantoate 2-reductase
VRHAVLGAGGIGGLLAAALARSGASTVLLLRDETLAAYPGRLVVQSAVLGDFEADVPATAVLDSEVDVVWVAVKATGLEAALTLAPPDRVGDATVIPLLNGIDHVDVLRARYRCVVPGAIRVESERVPPATVVQRSPFVGVELAGAPGAAADLRDAGIACSVRDDERSLLWEKLVFLAPAALATTALDASIGAVRQDARLVAAREEAFAVARAEGATIDEAALVSLHERAPDGMRSSMQKDVDAGREPELDAIAGPILRGGARHGIPVPATQELADLVAGRAAFGDR